MRKESKPRVVIDTNLLISAVIIPDSVPSQLLQAWKNDLYTLLISPVIMKEFQEVAKRDKFKKYHLLQKHMTELIESLQLSAEITPGISQKELPIHSRDPKDDIVLDCALQGNADYLITGDEDLLILDGNPALGALRIVKTIDFLNLYSRRNITD